MNEASVPESLTLARVRELVDRRLKRLVAAVVLATALSSPALALDVANAEQGTGTIEGAVQVEGRAGQESGPFWVLVVPAADAGRTLPENELKAKAVATDERGNFKKVGLAPGKYVVGVLLAPQVLVGSFAASIYVQTSLSDQPIFLPAHEVEVREGKIARVVFVRKPYPAPAPGLHAPDTGSSGASVGSAGQIPRAEGQTASDWLFITGGALILLAILGGTGALVSLRR